MSHTTLQNARRRNTLDLERRGSVEDAFPTTPTTGDGVVVETNSAQNGREIRVASYPENLNPKSFLA